MGMGADKSDSVWLVCLGNGLPSGFDVSNYNGIRIYHSHWANRYHRVGVVGWLVGLVACAHIRFAYIHTERAADKRGFACQPWGGYVSNEIDCVPWQTAPNYYHHHHCAVWICLLAHIHTCARAPHQSERITRTHGRLVIALRLIFAPFIVMYTVNLNPGKFSICIRHDLLQRTLRIPRGVSWCEL